MQFIKIGDTVVNKNQIKYIKKSRNGERNLYNPEPHKIVLVFHGKEHGCVFLGYGTEWDRDKAFDELFDQLSGSVQESVLCHSRREGWQNENK